MNDLFENVPGSDIMPIGSEEDLRNSPLVMTAFHISIYHNLPFPVNHIVDLGCYYAAPEAYNMGRHWNVEEVWACDPNGEISQPCQEVDWPLPKIHFNSPKVPVGLPAIAIHPGFSIPPEVYKLGRRPPPWSETLAKVNPSLIVFSAYAEDELLRDAQYLRKCGFVISRTYRHPLFRRLYKITENSGVGWCIALARRDNLRDL